VIRLIPQISGSDRKLKNACSKISIFEFSRNSSVRIRDPNTVIVPGRFYTHVTLIYVKSFGIALDPRPGGPCRPPAERCFFRPDRAVSDPHTVPRQNFREPNCVLFVIVVDVPKRPGQVSCRTGPRQGHQTLADLLPKTAFFGLFVPRICPVQPGITRIRAETVRVVFPMPLKSNGPENKIFPKISKFWKSNLDHLWFQNRTYAHHKHSQTHPPPTLCHSENTYYDP
jgi:hypothetical protein